MYNFTTKLYYTTREKYKNKKKINTHRSFWIFDKSEFTYQTHLN